MTLHTKHPPETRTSIIISTIGVFLFFSCCAILLYGLTILARGFEQHRVLSPDHRYTAIVFRDLDCGATCSCSMHVDVEAADMYLSRIYSRYIACDADVKWVDKTTMIIYDDTGQGERIQLQR